ncbi:RluA family pseudouridine synthase [Sulfurihydrogenibium yellowstonense]|uniref:Ribosomal large subunit pseudouridine synthase protein n=1 Tax=Sulfurihydrogenibium yellowstonense SS-5 TaxID=432331 RepID=C4FID2_9AQUI|nr:RluA family pseudouridine synthase [Sulfurihydrogenibium yellowstonense]EEP61178.1 ribosomal large subunit pseudouridine synthase protein [Sulfurihydrogenibium yellowstonense SS-5]
MLKRYTVNSPKTLKDFIAESLKISKNQAKDIIDSRNVIVNNKRVWIASHNLKPGDVVEIVQSEPKNDLKILYEDDYIIAIDKPPTIVSDKESSSAEDLLRKKLKNDKIKAIHRLDKETSGVLLFAKDYKIFEKFKEIWEDKNVLKIYLAISHNEANFKDFTINHDIEGKQAITHLKVLSKGNGFTYFQVRIETGRKHQIRKHLASIRHPIVGDKIYGIKKFENNLVKRVTRQMLHSHKLVLPHPYLNKKIEITAPIPSDFKNVLNYLNDI